MAMPDAIDSLINLALVPGEMLSRRMYNITGVQPIRGRDARYCRGRFPERVHHRPKSTPNGKRLSIPGRKTWTTRPRGRTGAITRVTISKRRFGII